MFKKYGSFKGKRKFDNDWTRRIELQNGIIIESTLPIYISENGKMRVTLSDDVLNKLFEAELRQRPELIKDYIKKHFFKSIFYFLSEIR